MVSLKRLVASVCNDAEVQHVSPSRKKRKSAIAFCPPPSTYVKKFICPFEFCNKAYTKTSKLADHERSHTGIRPFCCSEPACGKSFLRKSHLQAHARSHLPKGERPYACTAIHCDKRFSTNQHLRQHILLHTQPMPYKCDSCDQSFHKNNQLKKHIAHAHLMTKPCICSEPGCGMSFVYQSILDKHVSKAHDDTKRYVCEFEHCGEQFTKWSMLQAHCKDVHRLRCSYCNKLYADSCAFRLHVETHEVPLEDRQTFSCGIEECTKKFTKAHALRQHVRVIHEGIRRHECAICNKAFAYKKSLDNHIARFHGENDTVPGDRPKRRATVASATTLEKLTGVGYAESGRDIPCIDPQCTHRFRREYDLDRHLASDAHPEIEISLEDLLKGKSTGLSK